uniref:AC4 n=1 Tax=Mesocestoides corti TaxID=53468 RepID=A0A5K3FXC7_MESCO
MMNCIPHCQPKESPLTYANSINTSNTANPSYYSPTNADPSEPQDARISASISNASVPDLTGLTAANNGQTEGVSHSLDRQKRKIKE